MKINCSHCSSSQNAQILGFLQSPILQNDTAAVSEFTDQYLYLSSLTFWISGLKKLLFFPGSLSGPDALKTKTQFKPVDVHTEECGMDDKFLLPVFSQTIPD